MRISHERTSRGQRAEVHQVLFKDRETELVRWHLGGDTALLPPCPQTCPLRIFMPEFQGKAVVTKGVNTQHGE